MNNVSNCAWTDTQNVIIPKMLLDSFAIIIVVIINNVVHMKSKKKRRYFPFSPPYGNYCAMQSVS